MTSLSYVSLGKLSFQQICHTLVDLVIGCVGCGCVGILELLNAIQDLQGSAAVYQLASRVVSVFVPRLLVHTPSKLPQRQQHLVLKRRSQFLAGSKVHVVQHLGFVCNAR